MNAEASKTARAALRELPERVRTDRYLATVRTGQDPRLVEVVESASASLPLVSPHVREHARQIRLQNIPDARRLEQTRQALELRRMYLDHASGKIVEAHWEVRRLRAVTLGGFVGSFR
jgi:hypothetical protein